MNSGFYYLQFFDPNTQRFQEDNGYFSFSKFVNPSNIPLAEAIITPDAAFEAGLITSGQATGIGFEVVTTGVGDQRNTTLLYGPGYTKPSNDASFNYDPVCINGISYIKVAVTGAPDITGYPAITGYYLAIDLNPFPGTCS